MTSKEIAVIWCKQSVLFNYMHTLNDKVYTYHNNIVKIATSVSLYEYMH